MEKHALHTVCALYYVQQHAFVLGVLEVCAEVQTTAQAVSLSSALPLNHQQASVLHRVPSKYK